MAYLLRISRGCEYGIGAMKALSLNEPGTTLQAEEVAHRTGCPAKFTANLLTQLSKSGLLQGVRTAGRGYRLTRPADEISLLEIIEAIDGDFEKPWCFLDSGRKCDATDPCELHTTWSAIRHSVRETLANKWLSELATPFQHEDDSSLTGNIYGN